MGGDISGSVADVAVLGVVGLRSFAVGALPVFVAELGLVCQRITIVVVAGVRVVILILGQVGLGALRSDVLCLCAVVVSLLFEESFKLVVDLAVRVVFKHLF